MPVLSVRIATSERLCNLPYLKLKNHHVKLMVMEKVMVVMMMVKVTVWLQTEDGTEVRADPSLCIVSSS